jgi:heme ABC exporter ATP-binding subunit CcmA
MGRTTLPIQTEKLSKAYGMRLVLRDVGFEVGEGEAVALTGSNGAGKTTLLRCLAFVLRPTSGDVRWFGHSARKEPSARQFITLVAHDNPLYSHLTLRENLVFAARMHGLSQPHDHADRWLGKVELSQHSHRLPIQISQGMRQRLGIARALIHDPKVLLLDEPFSSLDSSGVTWLSDLLATLRHRGRAICFATHDERIVERLADRIVQVKSGQVHDRVAVECASSPPDQIVQRAA